MTRIVPIIVAALAALSLAACGESPEENSQQAVCDARQDISNQVDSLKGLTPETLSTDAVSENLSAIGSDLTDIRAELGDLADDRREQVESANKAFTSEVEGVLKDLEDDAGSGDAATALTAALQQLATSYEATFARVDCD